MHKVVKQTGAVIAAAAAVLFSTASFADDAAGTAMKGSVHCMGINSCKGQGKCNTATNSCAGQNSCKGKGWIYVAGAEECAKKGGTVVK